MRNLGRSALYYWLLLAATSGEVVASPLPSPTTTAMPQGANVLSCSDSTITLARSTSSAASSLLHVGQIFVHIQEAATATAGDDFQNQQWCRDDCGVLFREIVKDHGAGIYTTKAATFAQVFPAETYDADYAHVAIESILPTCTTTTSDIHYDSTMKMAFHALLQETPPPAPAPAVFATIRDLAEEAVNADKEDTITDIARKDDSKTNDDHYGESSEDDKYHPDDDKYKDEKASACRQFLDATKVFLYDIYCAVRNLECVEYIPDGSDDYHHYDDDDDRYSKDNDKYSDKDSHTRFLADATSDRKTTSSSSSLRIKGMRGVRRSLQTSTTTISFPGTVMTTNGETDTLDMADVVVQGELQTEQQGAEVVQTGQVETQVQALPEAQTQAQPEAQTQAKPEAQTQAKPEAQTESSKTEDHKSKDDTDDHYYDDDIYHDDDFYDDDDTVDDGANFWKILDAVLGYFESLYCIFARCQEHYPSEDDHYTDDKYQDSYDNDKNNDKNKDKDKDKPKRALFALEEPHTYSVQPSSSSSSWLAMIFGEPDDSEELQLQVPTTMEEWLRLDEDGNCPYTKCSDVDSPNQCFEGHHPVGKTCHDSLSQWFSVPSPGEDNVMSWELEMACYGQDYCYASNVFEQTMCDEQFYRSLMQACPGTGSRSMTLSSDAPLATMDLYEECSLVSILLYSKLQQQGRGMYERAQENQSVLESSDCRRRR